jgi:tRNA C32,U32 (ribose-2'-O)-methylase TrmJ
MLQNITQNIQTVNGTVIQQGQGTVQSTNTTNTTSDDLIALISKLSASLDDIDAIPDDEKDSVKDDLESIEEQIKSASPKKSRLNKALNGVKNFVCKFGESILVPVAIDKMQNVNWTDLIQQLEHFIAHIH